MEKSTISALILAGGTMLSAVVSVLVVGRARRAKAEKSTAPSDSGDLEPGEGKRSV